MTETELSARLSEIRTGEAAEDRRKAKELRRMRYIMRSRKNDALLRITNYGGYAPHVGYVEFGFSGTTLMHSGLHFKYPKNSNCQRWIKRETSRRWRNSIYTPIKGNYYRRLFDYWWTLY